MTPILEAALDNAIKAFTETLLYQVQVDIRRLEEKLNNTVGNAPAIFENMSDRMQKLEDRFEPSLSASETSTSFRRTKCMKLNRWHT